jgi:hypothetical protein
MGIEEAFTKLAGLCANEVIPSGIPCCGMAGDRWAAGARAWLFFEEQQAIMHHVVCRETSF